MGLLNKLLLSYSVCSLVKKQSPASESGITTRDLWRRKYISTKYIARRYLNLNYPSTNTKRFNVGKKKGIDGKKQSWHNI